MILRLPLLKQACRQKYSLSLVCLSLSLLVVGCSSQSKAPQLLPLHADTIVKRNFRRVVSSEGVIGNNNWVPFKPAQSGIVTQVLVEAGQKVQKGQVMLVLENKSQVADVATAKAEAQEAKLQASRYQFLADVGAVPPVQAEEKKIQAISKASAFVGAQVDLSHRYIKAPFDGIIATNFIVNVGTYVEAGQELFSLLNNDELLVQMSIPASQSKAIELGQSVRIYEDSSDVILAQGAIDYVAPAFDIESDGNTASPKNTVTVQASFPNVQVGLKPLELLRAEIETGVRNFPAIPTGAITMKAEQPFVFRLIPVNTFIELNKLDEKQSKPLKALPPDSLIAVESPITIGPLQDNQFPVLKGLVAGDKVAISQTKMLSSGMPVQILSNLPGK